MEVDGLGVRVYLAEDVGVVFAEAGGEIHFGWLRETMVWEGQLLGFEGVECLVCLYNCDEVLDSFWIRRDEMDIQGVFYTWER